MEDKTKIWKCTNHKEDEITLILHPNGNLRIIMDLFNKMTPDEVWNFIDNVNYKVYSTNYPKKTNKPHLKIVK